MSRDCGGGEGRKVCNYLLPIKKTKKEKKKKKNNGRQQQQLYILNKDSFAIAFAIKPFGLMK